MTYPPGFNDWPLEQRNEYFAKEAQAYERERAKAARGARPRPNGPDRETPRRTFVIHKANEMTFLPELEWLIKGVLPLQGVALLFGESQSFKSFCLMDIFARVSAGKDWAGRKTRRVPVLYIAAEAPESFAKRKTGIETANKEPLPDTFHVITVAPNLGTERNDLADLIVAIEEAGFRPGLIAIDTVSASLGGGEENGTGAQILLANARMLANHFEACVVPVHHPGLSEDRRPRGHSSLTGNVDVQILAERKKDDLATTLTVKKLKDNPSGLSLTLHLSPIVIGQDQDGDDVSTLVVTRIEDGAGGVAAAKPKSIPRSQRLLMDVVFAAIDEAGEEFRPLADGPLVRGVSEDAIRRRYYIRVAEQAEPGEDKDKLADRRLKAFKRALKPTIDAKTLCACERNGERYVWLP